MLVQTLTGDIGDEIYSTPASILMLATQIMLAPVADRTSHEATGPPF